MTFILGHPFKNGAKNEGFINAKKVHMKSTKINPCINPLILNSPDNNTDIVITFITFIITQYI